MQRERGLCLHPQSSNPAHPTPTSSWVQVWETHSKQLGRLLQTPALRATGWQRNRWRRQPPREDLHHHMGRKVARIGQTQKNRVQIQIPNVRSWAVSVTKALSEIVEVNKLT